jgi:hypothetical protein
MSPEMGRAKLRKLTEIEGFEDETALFAAAMTDSVCPAICCNPDNRECVARQTGWEGALPRLECCWKVSHCLI